MSSPASTAGVDPPGYAWTGELARVQITTIYSTCHALRFTGLLDLRDASHEAQVTFLGGDPVEIAGGDTQMIALWNEGQFKATQSIPNLSGELTGQIEQTGSLAITKAPRLLAWVSEYRLTCDLTIERPGEKALLVFKNGQLESAEVNGKPELSALARVQGWTDGFYRVQLRPLFADGFDTHAPAPSELHLPAAGEFDVSRSIPLDLKQKAKLKASEQSLDAERASITDSQRAQPRPSGTDLVAASERQDRPAAGLSPPAPERQEQKGRGLLWLGVVLVLVGGGGAAAYVLKLPPFSAPARPLDEPRAAVPPVAPPAADLAIAKVVEKKPEKAPEKVPEKVPEKPAEKPSSPVEEAKLEPHPTDKGPTNLPVIAPLDVRMIEKGRLLLIDGHPHSALSLFHKAERANPKNPLATTLEQQALGKLGRAEIIIEGKGSVTINGKVFSAPKKLKVLAGPYAISTKTGVEEVTLAKGEHHHLRARP